MLGAFPSPQSLGDGSVYTLGSKSPHGLFGTWKVTPPHFLPHEKGVGEDLALAMGQVMALSCPWALEQEECHQDRPLFGIRF